MIFEKADRLQFDVYNPGVQAARSFKYNGVSYIMFTLFVSEIKPGQGVPIFEVIEDGVLRPIAAAESLPPIIVSVAGLWIKNNLGLTLLEFYQGVLGDGGTGLANNSP